jgi:hypothetical protein
MSVEKGRCVEKVFAELGVVFVVARVRVGSVTRVSSATRLMDWETSRLCRNITVVALQRLISTMRDVNLLREEQRQQLDGKTQSRVPFLRLLGAWLSRGQPRLELYEDCASNGQY